MALTRLVRMLSALVFALLLATPAFAQQVPPPHPDSPPVPADGADWWRDVLRRYDTNGNGKLDNDEWTRFWQDMQEEDVTEDGYLEITWEEFFDMLRRMYPGMPEQDIRNIFNEIDTNGDGVISWDEWKKFRKRVDPPTTGTGTGGGIGGDAGGTPGGN